MQLIEKEKLRLLYHQFYDGNVSEAELERFDFVLQKAKTIEALPVNQGTPLTLEELRQMQDNPVWVEVINHEVFANKDNDFNSWGMVRKSWVRVWDMKCADLLTIDYHFEDYGKEWLAYSAPVKRGRWVQGNDDQDSWTCSECGLDVLPADDPSTPYELEMNLCYRCGALMVKEVKYASETK